MSLPTKTTVQTIDFDWYGQPFVQVATQNSIDTTTLDYDWYGQPFVTNPNDPNNIPLSGDEGGMFYQVYNRW